MACFVPSLHSKQFIFLLFLLPLARSFYLQTYMARRSRPIPPPFLCRCETDEVFDTYGDWVTHAQNDHGCYMKLSEFLKDAEEKDVAVKFYWTFSCRCGNQYTSSLCNADMIIDGFEIQPLKIYGLRCLRCKKYASFVSYQELLKYLTQRVKQKLIIWNNEDIFREYSWKPSGGKELKDHKQELCEKCKILGSFCGSRSRQN